LKKTLTIVASMLLALTTLAIAQSNSPLPKSPVSTGVLMSRAVRAGAVHLTGKGLSELAPPPLTCSPTPCALPNQNVSMSSVLANETPVVVNPKNLVLVIGAAAAIAQTGASTGAQAGALAVFVIIASLGPGIPVGIYFVMGARGKHILDGLRAWMARENAVIMAVICLLIGVKLIGDAITGFTA